MGGDTNASSNADDVEVEWQFDALDLRPVERWLASLPTRGLVLRGVGTTSRDQEGREGTAISTDGSSASLVARQDPPPVVTLTAVAKQPRRLFDRYLDTQDWRVARAGYVLRARRHGRHEEVTLKNLKPATAAGLRRRMELTEELQKNGSAGWGRDGPVTSRVAAMAGKQTLQPVLEVRTRRRPFALRAGDTEVAEVALDETTIIGGNEKPVRLRRVEVELDPGWVGTLEPIVEDLVEACGLRPASLSKFEAGLLGLGMSIPGPPQLGSTEISPRSTMAQLAFAVLRRHFGQLVVHEPGTRLGEDPEDLHDMRVATRRLRAALDVFADLLPVRAHNARGELGWLGDVLGAIRDLDVQLERHEADVADVHELLGMSAAEELEPLRQRLLQQRSAARATLLDALDSERYQHLIETMTSMVRRGVPRRTPLARSLGLVGMPDLIQERHRKARKAARRAHKSGLASDYHRLRIRCKRLRYCLEFTRNIYDARTERYVRKLTKLQDLLGALQDDEVAVTRLHDLATSKDFPLPPGTVYVMGAMAAHYRSGGRSLLARARKRIAALEGREWETVSKMLERERAQALAVLPIQVAGTWHHPEQTEFSHTVPTTDDRVADDAGPVGVSSTEASQRSPFALNSARGPVDDDLVHPAPSLSPATAPDPATEPQAPARAPQPTTTPDPVTSPQSPATDPPLLEAEGQNNEGRQFDG